MNIDCEIESNERIKELLSQLRKEIDEEKLRKQINEERENEASFFKEGEQVIVTHNNGAVRIGTIKSIVNDINKHTNPLYDVLIEDKINKVTGCQLSIFYPNERIKYMHDGKVRITKTSKQSCEISRIKISRGICPECGHFNYDCGKSETTYVTRLNFNEDPLDNKRVYFTDRKCVNCGCEWEFKTESQL